MALAAPVEPASAPAANLGQDASGAAKDAPGGSAGKENVNEGAAGTESEEEPQRKDQDKDSSEDKHKESGEDKEDGKRKEEDKEKKLDDKGKDKGIGGPEKTTECTGEGDAVMLKGPGVGQANRNFAFFTNGQLSEPDSAGFQRFIAFTNKVRLSFLPSRDPSCAEYGSARARAVQRAARFFISYSAGNFCTANKLQIRCDACGVFRALHLSDYFL